MVAENGKFTTQYPTTSNLIDQQKFTTETPSTEELTRGPSTTEQLITGGKKIVRGVGEELYRAGLSPSESDIVESVKNLPRKEIRHLRSAVGRKEFRKAGEKLLQAPPHLLTGGEFEHTKPTDFLRPLKKKPRGPRATDFIRRRAHRPVFFSKILSLKSKTPMTSAQEQPFIAKISSIKRPAFFSTKLAGEQPSKHNFLHNPAKKSRNIFGSIRFKRKMI